MAKGQTALQMIFQRGRDKNMAKLISGLPYEVDKNKLATRERQRQKELEKELIAYVFDR